MAKIFIDGEVSSFDKQNGVYHEVTLLKETGESKTWHIDVETYIGEVSHNIANYRRSNTWLQTVLNNCMSRPVKDVVADMLEFIGTSFDKIELVGHNAYNHDINYLNRLLRESGEPLAKHNNVIDTLQMARVARQTGKINPENEKLGTLCKYFNIKFDDSKWHDSAYDALKCKELYYKLI